MIKTNLRTLKTIGAEYLMKTGLCEACGNCEGCSIQRDDVIRCTDYQPVVAFKSFDGTEDRFNTFRLGGAWFNRVKAGQSVGLINREGIKVGEAVVEAVHCGEKEEMLQAHAAANHLILAKPDCKPVTELKRLLRNLYGPNFLAKAELMTVIYLRRVNGNG